MARRIVVLWLAILYKMGGPLKPVVRCRRTAAAQLLVSCHHDGEPWRGSSEAPAYQQRRLDWPHAAAPPWNRCNQPLDSKRRPLPLETSRSLKPDEKSNISSLCTKAIFANRCHGHPHSDSRVTPIASSSPHRPLMAEAYLSPAPRDSPSSPSPIGQVVVSSRPSPKPRPGHLFLTHTHTFEMRPEPSRCHSRNAIRNRSHLRVSCRESKTLWLAGNGGKVLCWKCHQVHFGQSPGYLPSRRARLHRPSPQRTVGSSGHPPPRLVSHGRRVPAFPTRWCDPNTVPASPVQYK